DNLKPDKQYITGWLSSGWTNDVMTYTNLLFLSLLTERIPVLGPFVPSHLSPSAGYLPFSEVFDLPLLAHELHTPILEWSDVKRVEDDLQGEREAVGCWSTWAGWEWGNGQGRSGWVPDTFDLDVSYTPVPQTYDSHNPQDPHVSLARLMTLSFSSSRSLAIARSVPLPSPLLGATLPPSDHLLCFDLLYYARLVEGKFEWEEDYSPAWRLVGRKMRWAPLLLQKAEIYLREHWQIKHSDPIPPYISVHMRRADFRAYCNGTLECMPTLHQLERRVSSVRSQLLFLGISAPYVLLTSDETDASWWASLPPTYGQINHTLYRTEEKYGEWYPSVLDSVFLSLGSGFVGTEGSTMSLLAYRRVRERGGVGEWVRWKGVPEGEL
ncbi:hypothetical protein DACRYDRAFT_55580, partial [Dacryopinax primogenitus]